MSNCRPFERVLVICLLSVGLGNASAADDGFAESRAMLERTAELHRELPGGAVVISTTIRNAGASVSAPPTRGGFAFLREHDSAPARLRAECWSGPSGGVDMVCDGKTQFLGDPLRRIYRTASAPRVLSDFLNDLETASLLGVGPTLLLSWLCDEGGMIQPIANPVKANAAGQEAWMIEGLAAGPDEDLTIRYFIAADGDPLLLSAHIPVPGGAMVEVAFHEWKTGIVQAPKFASSFKIEQRPNWEYNESTGNVHVAQLKVETESPDEPVRSLIGGPAPAITVFNGRGATVDLNRFQGLTDGKVSVILFWSAGEAPDHDAFAALKVSGPMLASLGATVIAVNLDGPGEHNTEETPDFDSSPIEFKGDATVIARQWKLSGLPTMVVLDARGQVRAVQVGFPGREEMSKRLRSAVTRLRGEVAAADTQVD